MADSRFTSTALGAIRLAQENAARLGHCYVGSEHLLLGLACQEYSLAASLLREAGADSRSLRAAVVQMVGTGAPGPTLRQGLTPRCCQVIRRAAEESSGWAVRRWGRSTCCWGVLLEPDSSGARLLGACEVDREGLRRAVYAALGGEGWRASPHAEPGAGAGLRRHPPAGPVRPGSDPDGGGGAAGSGDRPGGGAGPGDPDPLPPGPRTTRPLSGSLVGKTAVVEGLALAIADGTAPAHLLGNGCAPGPVRHGGRHQVPGEFEEKLKHVLRRCAGRAILFFYR